MYILSLERIRSSSEKTGLLSEFYERATWHICMYMYIYVCVCMRVCMHVCVCVCMHACVNVCMHVSMYLCECVYAPQHSSKHFLNFYDRTVTVSMFYTRIWHMDCKCQILITFHHISTKRVHIFNSYIYIKVQTC